MSRHRSSLFLFVCPLVLSAAACGSSSDSAGSVPAVDAAPPEDDAGVYVPPPVTEDASQDAFVPVAPDACVPQPGADVPDDDFDDENCDGIDGDVNHAIFVAPTGNDSAAGGIGAPVKTLGKAVKLAAAAGKDVYVCNATYAENVVVTTTTNVYGGYDCAHAWQRILDQPTIAATSGIPLTIKAVSGPLTIDRVALTAPDALNTSDSSIAAMVVSSPTVTLRHIQFQAGSGADGTTPKPPTVLTPAATSGTDGQSLVSGPCTNPPAPSQSSSCNTSGAAGEWGLNGYVCENRGGGGGTGGDVADSIGAEPGQSNPNGTPPGAPGGVGANGAPGTPASSGFGSIDATGYHASNGGGAGSNGASGAGGGGGGGGASNFTNDLRNSWYAGGGGGGGGSGGCGGSSSSGSDGGGASIGLLLVDSPATVVFSQITTMGGGRGGTSIAGADGQEPGAGGAGGKGTEGPFSTAGDGQPGAPGGRGGKGGPGGPGGGGPSLGILASGAAPTIDSTVTINAGPGGKGGAAILGPDGADGLAQDVFTVGVPDGGAADANRDAK